MSSTQTESSNGPRILRGAFDSLSLYEITDYELESLEEGSPSSTFLNFAIAFVSIGLSFLTTLLTVKIESIYVFLIFVVLTIIGLAAALVLFVLWRKTRSRVKDLVKKIKARAPASSTEAGASQGG
ncbi:MAG: hypothetical protein F9K31_04590 [Dokdonella sp.]|jgi:hypothetical protein|nr:MAG: hypothetical protein F9K31_04590 [Dokdonella sp.]